MTKSLQTDQTKDKLGIENHLHPTEARWFAVHTGFRKEKKVVELLALKGITAYTPIQQVKRFYTRKVKKVELPLINCYVFVHITNTEYVSVLETAFVNRFLKINRNLIAIPEAEIELLRRIVGEDLGLEAVPATFQPGDPVVIMGGQLTGMEGTLRAVKGKQRFVIALETLGYELLMEVDPKYIHRR
ncbi:MAG: UpxY family transcription antiterminator [Saprospiraceae bacterium]